MPVSSCVSRQMICSWFASTGQIVKISLVECCAVNTQWYTEVCLPQLFAAVEDKVPCLWPWKTSLASAHTAQLTRDYFEGQKVKLEDHPPHSPDLGPCEFDLFLKAKEMLKGKLWRPTERSFLLGLWRCSKKPLKVDSIA